MSTKQSNVLGAAIVGGAVGVAAALLVAPKSGKETRQDIKQMTDRAMKRTKDNVEKGKQTAKKVSSTLKDTKDDLANKAKNITDDLKKEGQASAEHTKEAVQDKLRS